MVAGIDSFRDKFRGFEDCYTVIGGAACDILMSEADIDFRLTKDIDMILILEDKKEEFAKTFWEYIKEGKYKCGWKNSDKMHFYRFTEPIDGYPVMIELFSRKPGYNLIETCMTLLKDMQRVMRSMGLCLLICQPDPEKHILP